MIPAVLVGIAVVSAAVAVEEHHVGNWAYSRYVAFPALMTCGVVAFAGCAKRRAWSLVARGLAVTAGIALVLQVWADAKLRDYEYVAFDFPETSPLMRSWTVLHLGTATAVVAGLLVLLAALTAFRDTCTSPSG